MGEIEAAIADPVGHAHPAGSKWRCAHPFGVDEKALRDANGVTDSFLSRRLPGPAEVGHRCVRRAIGVRFRQGVAVEIDRGGSERGREERTRRG